MSDYERRPSRGNADPLPDDEPLQRADGVRLRVLVVEDDALMRDVLELELREFGAEVLDGTDKGEDGIDLVEEHQPDVVVMDVSLRGSMDGITAAEQIIERFRTPVVFVTGNSDHTTRERISALKGAEFLSKPAPMKTLIEAVLRACGIDDRPN